MSKPKWLAEGGNENDLTDQMEIDFLKLDGAENAANNIKLNNTIEKLKSIIQGLAFKINSGGTFSASTIPLSSNTTPISAGISPSAGGGFTGASLNPFSFGADAGAGAGAGALSFGATPGSAAPAIDIPTRPFLKI